MQPMPVIFQPLSLGMYLVVFLSLQGTFARLDTHAGSSLWFGDEINLSLYGIFFIV